MSNKVDLQLNLIKSNQFLSAAKDPQSGRGLEYLPSKPNWFSRLVGWLKGVHPSSNLDRVIAIASKIAQGMLNNPSCNVKQITILQRNLACLHAKAIKHNTHWFVRLMSCFTKRVLCNSDTLVKIKEQIQQLDSIKGKKEADEKNISSESEELPIETTKTPDSTEDISAIKSIEIVNQLVQNGNLDKALEVAQSIPNEAEMDGALEKVAMVLVAKKDLNKALVPLKSIKGYLTKYEMIKIIMQMLTESQMDYYKYQTFLKLMNIIEKIADPTCKENCLSCVPAQDLISYYISNSNFDKAYEKIKIIMKALTESQMDYNKYQTFLKLMNIIEKIVDIKCKENCLNCVPAQELITYYTSKGNVDKAIANLKKIKSSEEKYFVCTKVMKDLTLKGWPDKSFILATEIFTDKVDLDRAIKSGIVNELIASKHFEIAYIYSCKIEDKVTKSLALQRLIKHGLLPDGQLAFAKQAANSIPIDDVKAKVFWQIKKLSEE